jgi:hypothetical protein
MSVTPSPTPPDAANAEGDWRVSVPQSYRNTEVREIAKVLAALEPGASAASKLMLAMRFEDSLWRSASSLSDYRKKLAKRLKKVQKSYKPTAPTPTPEQQAATTSSELLQQLRQKFGHQLRYVAERGDQAVIEMRSKHGSEKAHQLQQHVDGAKQWAADLGIFTDDESKWHLASCHLSEEQLRKLQAHLDRRMDNIRSHVVKQVDPNLFVEETLQKAEDDTIDPRNRKASKLLALTTNKRWEKLAAQQAPSLDITPTLLVNMLQEAQHPVPPPTRNRRNEKEGALLHLAKMRAASTAVLAYMGLAPEVKENMVLPRNALVKCHHVALQGAKAIAAVLQELQDKEGSDAATDPCTLEDAWNKVLVPSHDMSATTGHLDETNAASKTSNTTVSHVPPAKRLKLSSSIPRLQVYYKSRVLLTKGRKTPSNLVPALQRKRVKLIRGPDGDGTHLILEFGTAFTMTIYMVPLLVTVRAYSTRESTVGASPTTPNATAKVLSGHSSVVAGCTWTPIQEGLLTSTTAANNAPEHKLQVWGVQGTYSQLGHVVEERLRYASAHCTQVLRQCFGHHVRSTAVAEFEVEILEASALLEFLQLARTTYINNWHDDE